MTLCIITLGIDLSLGSVVGFLAASFGEPRRRPGWKEALWPSLPQLPAFVAVLAGLGVGLLLGSVNGGLIAAFRIPPFIATLGMMTIARGFAYIYSNGRRSPLSTTTSTGWARGHRRRPRADRHLRDRGRR